MFLNDLVLIGLAFRLSYFIRFESAIPVFQEQALQSLSFYRTLVFILIPIWLTVFAIVGLYNRQNLLGGTREYSLVFNGTTIGMFLVIAAGFLAHDYVFARGWLLMAWGIAFTLISLGRFLLRRVIYYLRGEGYYLSPAVIVGANDEGISLAQQLSKWKTSGFHVIGFVDKKLPAGYPVLKNLQCLGSVDQLDSILANYSVEEIILATSAISSRDKMLDIFKRYGVTSNVNVRMSSGLYEIITTGLTVKDFAYVPLVGVNPVRLTGLDRVMKWSLDYTLTIIGLILISPLLFFLALAIKLDSPGPVIHRRRVMGMNGSQFDAFKFRTMRSDGDDILAARPELQAELAQFHKLKDDPRVTRTGKWLRRFSLDELPQLFNVLFGQMSLVGPRMISPEEISNYNQWDINLLTIRPGLTGLWQVSGRSDVTYDERVRLDMYYIRNWSIWLDLQLLLQTIPAVFYGHGAY
ncbi:MAG: glycosyl transferase [Chloroflexi bacterium RBG_16_58_14]|nr:MAG: glycosyl transferase [Chloroflexi bacterium RBG_16_58_14]